MQDCMKFPNQQYIYHVNMELTLGSRCIMKCKLLVEEGAKYLEMAQGGHGVLLGGVPGVDPGTVLIFGGGVVGLSAAKIACGLGANVYVLDTNLDRLRYMSDVMPSNCFTSMSNPTYIVDGIVHYAVSNMPGALPRTSSMALTNATLPYVLEIADKGWQLAMKENPEIKCGANVVKGQVAYKGVADALDIEYSPIEKLLANI